MRDEREMRDKRETRERPAVPYLVEVSIYRELIRVSVAALPMLYIILLTVILSLTAVTSGYKK